MGEVKGLTKMTVPLFIVVGLVFMLAPPVLAEQGGELLSVICRLADNPIKEWALTKVIVESGKFVHESVRTYFSLRGALKEHCKLVDVPFDESIDDYS